METGYIKINIEEGKTPCVEANLVNNTVWMSKATISRLLNCFNQKIEMNLRSIFKSHLLWEKDVSFTYRYMDKGIEKQIVYYNLEVLIFLCYRIATFEAKIFRQFINSSLREHLQAKKTPDTTLYWSYLPVQSMQSILRRRHI
jgi:hypothetical protein